MQIKKLIWLANTQSLSVMELGLIYLNNIVKVASTNLTTNCNRFSAFDRVL